MEFRKVLALRGPNMWTNYPVLEIWVHLNEWKDTPSTDVPGFADRLMAWLPTMIEHRCGIGERGGFFQRLRTGTYLAHILEHVSIELQILAGYPVDFGRAREWLGDGYYKVAIEFIEEDVCRAAIETARELIMAALHDKPFDVQAEVRKLRELGQRVQLGPSTRSIVNAAQARGIPIRRLNTGSLVQLGHGTKQRRICAAQTDRTGAVAEEIAQDKDLTRSLLRSAGVPVPEGRPVESADDAWEAAEEISGPVVVKPQYGSQGRGVATNLTTREQVVAAFDAASRESSYIMVERFAPGSDYRVLVIGGKVIAASRREPAHVIGDGKHSITELVELINTDPRRGDDHSTSLSKIVLDQIALGVLAEQNYTPGSVPALGVKVLCRRNANLSTGGSAEDVTDLVHPEVASRCIDAARVVGLDICGVDVVAVDISRPLEEQGGVIVEVNASPGLRMHLEPSSGKPRAVGEAIIDSMFAPGDNARIPLVAVTGTNGKTTTVRFIAHMLGLNGRTVGMTCTDGIYVGRRRIDTGDCAGPQSAANVLMNPNVEAAVLETARGGILRAGLGFDRCDVAVVTNIADGDHLGVSGIETPEQIAMVKRTIVDVVHKQGYAVLKADDPLCAQMVEYGDGMKIFFCRDPEHEVIQNFRKQGGRCVIVRENAIVAAEGDREEVILSLDRVPLTLGGRVGFQVENALATVGAAWGLGLSRETIRLGLETFSGDMGQVPGRFNLLEINGAKVIVDYGHNPSALQAMIESIKLFPAARRLAVYSAAGDRRDIDMIRQGEMLAAEFDHVVLYEDHYLRGRQQGEIIKLFRKGMEATKRNVEVTEIQGAVKAVETALDMLRPGDLLLCQADVIDETVNFLKQYLSARQTGLEPRVVEPLATPLPETVVYATESID
ncbi:MAG: cyanophycin synthetase [Planctomycetes bacterium]|nr:cyanophycin synthetase [Planctomycetota bacterium]